MIGNHQKRTGLIQSTRHEEMETRKICPKCGKELELPVIRKEIRNQVTRSFMVFRCDHCSTREVEFGLMAELKGANNGAVRTND